METTQVPISGWVDKKLWYVYTMEYYVTKKRKKETLPFAIARKDLEIIMLSEIASQRKTNTIWPHLYVDETGKLGFWREKFQKYGNPKPGRDLGSFSFTS